MEVLKAYSHTPGRLDDLRKAVEIVRRREPRGGCDGGRNEAASRPSQWALADRLSPNDVQTITEQYQMGTIGKGLAAEFGISLSSIRRLLRKHGARLSDHHEDTN